MVGSAEAAHTAQVAQLKEELYADLTGLILRGVDRLEDADVYDCIQTGRNGSMYFSRYLRFLPLFPSFLLEPLRPIRVQVTNTSSH